MKGSRFATPLLLALFVAAGMVSLLGESATFDETAHLPAGYTYLDRRDFRLNPEHPPLSKMWAALPVKLLGLTEADYASPYWSGTSSGSGMRTLADQWKFGFEFLNGPLGEAERRDPERILAPARAMMLLLGVGLCLTVRSWSREILGPAAGEVALFLCALSPTILAHARLVTTDLPAAMGFTGTLYAAWRFTRKPSFLRGAVMALTLGLSLLVKYTMILLVPLVVLLLGLWVFVGRDTGGPRVLRARLACMALAAALPGAWIVLWGGYGFRHEASSEPGYRLPWEAIEKVKGISGEVHEVARAWHALPEAYLYGYAYAAGGAERRLAFLDGEQSFAGWRSYFPRAFLMKTPISFLLLLGWAAAAWVARTRLRSYDGLFVGVPVLVYSGIAIAGNLNIGHRHLAPLYPLLCIVASSLAVHFEKRGLRTAILAGLLGSYAVSFVLASPGYLAYFNVAAGGAKAGWRHLVDSNIDWGQDLPSLASWMEANGVGRVHLAYFGTADPRAYGITYDKVAMIHDFRPEEATVMPRSGDLLAASVTLLQGVYLDRDREFAEEAKRRGKLTRALYERWTASAQAAIVRGEGPPALEDFLIAAGAISRGERDAIAAPLLTTLLGRLREREPVARVGDSIRIYRVP